MQASHVDVEAERIDSGPFALPVNVRGDGRSRLSLSPRPDGPEYLTSRRTLRCSVRPCGLLETSRRIGVRPDSVQVLGGALSSGLPTRIRVWLTSGLRPVGHRDEAWLQKGLPCS